MDQVSTPSRYRGPQSAAASPDRPSASQLQGLASSFAAPHPGSELEENPGEDPYSPGFHSPGSRSAGAVDPLAETLGAMAGALLAMLTLVVPLLGVISDRRDEPASSRLPQGALVQRQAAQAKRP
jgi:hypothetical protein